MHFVATCARALQLVLEITLHATFLLSCLCTVKSIDRGQRLDGGLDLRTGSAVVLQVPWHAQELTAEHTGALAAACHRAACDPTVTISTKAAFEALGGAFASRLPHEEHRYIHCHTYT